MSGEVDASTTATLSSFLTPLPGGSGEVSLDMSGVTFIDSSGLRALIEAHQRAEKSHRRLIITKPSSIVSRLIELSGLGDLFNLSKER